MPEIQTDGLDVSAEEERYLRGAFRRFALPYLVATLAMAGFAVAAVSLTSEAPSHEGSEELQSLVAEAASLREAIAGLRQELRDHASDEGGRIAKLESGIGRLDAGGSPDAELISRLDHAHERISALEGRLAQVGTAAAVPPQAAPSPSWSPASPSIP